MILPRTILTGFACAVLALLSGCKEEEYRLRFSHHLHVTENGLECADCHGAPGAAAFKPISHATCADCHDEVAAEKISKDTCGICHEERQLSGLKEWKAGADGRHSLFVHTDALAGRCQECHAPIMAEKLDQVPQLRHGDIIKLRDEAHFSAKDCATCHVDMDRNTAPASHDQLWMRRHGLLGMQDEAACSVCHAEESCRQCHAVEQPVSHNNLWRLRTHGIQASWNREGCLVCHEEDSCTSCHSQNQPRSHNARWRENHCYGCHTDTPPNEGCVVCHEEGGSVLLHEGFWPPVHNLFGNQANCYDCHYPYEQ